MSRIIRRARTGDLAALVPLVEQYLGFYNVKHPRATVSRFISQKLRAKPVLVWVGSRARGTALDGFVQVYPTFSTLRLGPAWILNDLFVAKTARGTGMGRALLETVIAEAKRSGARTVELTTAVTNASARALYQSIGFKTDPKYLVYSLPIK